MKELEIYLINTFYHHSTKELNEELNFFLDRGYCANNTNQEQFNLTIQVLKNLIEKN